MVDFNNGSATASLCDRMQNLALNPDAKAKFYHYCYVCNTQLNSCKQALLHCSGKRHKKKLQFLQSRNNAPGHISNNGPSTFSSTVEQNGNGFIYPAPAGYHTVHSTQNFGAEPSVLPPMPAPLPIAPVPPPFYPPIVGGHPQHHHTVQAHDHWLPSAMMAYHHNHHQPPMPHLMLAMQPHAPPLFAASNNNSFLMPGESLRNSSSAYSDSTRSPVVSPSVNSSLSSELFRVNKCQMCQRKFTNGVQLHAHLQNARHYKCAPTQSSPCYELMTRKAGDSSETDSYVSTSSVYFCAMCNMDINTQQYLVDHTDDESYGKLNGRSVASGSHRHPSRSSSTSSEPIEIVVDSGYVSGSGDELICVSHPTPDRPTAKFRCQLCNTFLNSPAQAKQHLSSQKHLMRVNSCRKPVFRRRTCNSFKKKHSYQNAISQDDKNNAEPCERENVTSDNCDSCSLLSPDPDSDVTTVAVIHKAQSL